jgi:hypothetical protein
MAIPHTVGAFAIVPSNDLRAAVPFWERLGFERTGGDSNYIIMTGWGCEVHLTQAGEGLWSVPEQNNPLEFSSERPTLMRLLPGWTTWSFGPEESCGTESGDSMR